MGLNNGLKLIKIHILCMELCHVDRAEPNTCWVGVSASQQGLVTCLITLCYLPKVMWTHGRLLRNTDVLQREDILVWF